MFGFSKNRVTDNEEEIHRIFRWGIHINQKKLNEGKWGA